MVLVICAIIIFGFIHPGSKLLLDSGIPLSYFCFLFIFVRLIVTVPIALIRKVNLKIKKKDLPAFVLFGALGCALQFTEFKGISEGLPPNLVTFLMFSFPVWLTLFSILKNKTVDHHKLFQSLCILLGLFYVTDGQFEVKHSTLLIFPIIAGFSLALWVVISKYLRNQGIGSLVLSIYYDAFSLAAILILFFKPLTLEYSNLILWSSSSNLTYIIFYSLVAGLLPNLLFYQGSKSISTHTSGHLMSFEPLLSTFYSVLLWGVSTTGGYFWLGSLFVLLGNLPKNFILNILNKGENNETFCKNKLI